ncbi:hypothetical protein [Moorena sp. SIO3B2]|uniref:hypothetical protein n=2 Tax=unclassified Moorena TaxID=2683338 RepID=UPI0013CB33AA|nr:hypothetical protein [Moorena sp. SIO3B2]NEP30884.1 hypothetical protein [Moorena sp. SIO3B2]
MAERPQLPLKAIDRRSRYAIALPDDLIVLQAKVQDMVTSIVLELFHYANNFTDRSKSFLLLQS